MGSACATGKTSKQDLESLRTRTPLDSTRDSRQRNGGLRVHTNSGSVFDGVTPSPSKRIPRELTFTESLELRESFADIRMQEEAMLHNIVSHAAREFIDVSSHVPPPMSYVVAEREAMYSTIRENSIVLMQAPEQQISMACISLPSTYLDQQREQEIRHSRGKTASTQSSVAHILQQKNDIEHLHHHTGKPNNTHHTQADDALRLEGVPNTMLTEHIETRKEGEEELEGGANIKEHTLSINRALAMMQVEDIGPFVISFDDATFSAT